GVQAHAGPLQPRGQRLARGLGWATTDLPVLRLELRIANHLPPVADIVQQLVGGWPLAPPNARPPVKQLLPRRVVTIVFEGVQHVASFIVLVLPGARILRRGKKRLPPHRLASARPSRKRAGAGRRIQPVLSPRCP